MGVVAENQALSQDYQEQLSNWRDRAERYESFFRGGQYSRKEKKILKNYGLIPLVINLTRPLISQRRAILTSSKPTWRVVPLQGGNKLIAEAAQQYLVGKWNADYVDTQLNLALKDCLITGVGYLFVDLASFLDNSTFDINIKKLSWNYVLPDPKAQEFDLSDAENILIRKFVSLSRARVLYGLTKEEAESSISESAAHNTGNTEATQQVEVLDRFSKYPVTQYHVTPAKGEFLRDLPTIFYTDDLTTKTSQENRALAEDMKRLSVEGTIELKEMRQLHIYRAISVGDLAVYSGVMNIRDYPIIPFIDEHGTTFEKCQGDVEFIEGIQKAINKFYLLTMHNAMLTGNFRVMGPKNAVKNKTQFQRTSALPGAYLEYEPDPTLPNGGKPEIIQPGTLSSAFYGLTGDLMDKAKFELSVFSPVMGDARGTPETFSTTASLQDFGTQSIKELARRIDVQVAKVGEIVLQYIQNYTGRNELLEYIDISSGELRSPMVEDTNQAAQAEPADNEEQDVETQKKMMAIKLNEVIIKAGIVAEIKNNTRLGKYAVKVLTQPNLGTDRLIKASFMRDMIMNKTIPATPSVIAAMMDLMEFPGATKLVEQFKKDVGAEQKAKQAEEQATELVRRLKMAETENMKLMKRLELKDLQSEIEIMKTELKGQGEKALSEVTAQLEATMNTPASTEPNSGA